MTTILPIDANDNAIPALRLKDGGSHTISAVTGASAVNVGGFSSETKIVSIYATGGVYISFGDNGVVATSSDHYFPEGVYYDFAIGGYGVDHTPYIGALAATADCTVYISEKE